MVSQDTYIYQQIELTTAEWALNETIYPESVWLFERLGNGKFNMKLSDGVHTFAELAEVFVNQESIDQAITNMLTESKNYADERFQSKEEGKGLSANDFTVTYKDQLDFLLGSNTVTSVSNLPVSKHLVSATIDADDTISLDGELSDGQSMHILVKNAGATDRTITIPTTGNFVSMSGDSKVLPANGWLEISIVYDQNHGVNNIRVGESE